MYNLCMGTLHSEAFPHLPENLRSTLMLLLFLQTSSAWLLIRGGLLTQVQTLCGASLVPTIWLYHRVCDLIMRKCDIQASLYMCVCVHPIPYLLTMSVQLYNNSLWNLFQFPTQFHGLCVQLLLAGDVMSWTRMIYCTVHFNGCMVGGSRKNVLSVVKPASGNIVPLANCQSPELVWPVIIRLFCFQTLCNFRHFPLYPIMPFLLYVWSVYVYSS